MTEAIAGYHAHVYYDDGSREAAARLREALGTSFDVQLGRWHDQPVGPHPSSMYQVAFPVAEFARVVPFLMLNRSELDILVHPLTGNDYLDHSNFALWMGKKLALRLETLSGAPK
jgi:aromatic ring-cleaving dioxygenase